MAAMGKILMATSGEIKGRIFWNQEQAAMKELPQQGGLPPNIAS